jgi:excisionase family DNA binding protein
MLRLSVKSIYRLVEQDPSIPAIKLGGAVRFPRAMLLRWLEQHTRSRSRPRSAQGSAHGGPGAA